MLEKLFYYLQGYLILELNGDSKERFINLCKNKDIEITFYGSGFLRYQVRMMVGALIVVSTNKKDI
jgi:tRNA U38,U39,U40 pseudouridine synthase TruA